MRFDASGLRRTSALGEVFPWRAQDVTFVCVTADGLVTQAQTIGEKRAILEAADDGDLLLAAWPGQWRQDIFVVDDRDAALEGLEPPGQADLSDNLRFVETKMIKTVGDKLIAGRYRGEYVGIWPPNSGSPS